MVVRQEPRHVFSLQVEKSYDSQPHFCFGSIGTGKHICSFQKRCTTSDCHGAGRQNNIYMLIFCTRYYLIPRVENNSSSGTFVSCSACQEWAKTNPEKTNKGFQAVAILLLKYLHHLLSKPTLQRLCLHDYCAPNSHLCERPRSQWRH